MNNGPQPASSRLADLLAVKLQEWHAEGKLKGTQPLLRIDNREAAAEAPFQFDPVNGQLHRSGCRSIPKHSRSALYAVWRIGNDEQKLACSRCRPVPTEDNSEDRQEDRHFTSDLLYGLLSVVDQFGGVLRERGLEYRKSSDGQRLAGQLQGFYHGLGEQEKSVVQAALISLDGLAKSIRDLDASLHNANGHANGHDEAASAGRKKNRQNGRSPKS
jgi:hypothetical protein